MRLRNIPYAKDVLAASSVVIKNETNYRGNWSQKVFGNTQPLHIEIGMGKGKFLTKLAMRNPDINYIGIERYSSVLLRAVEKLEKLRENENISLPNIRFVCMDAANIAEVFAPEEVDRIYLNFSDPWPKSRHARRRLTSSEYFERYDKVLVSGGRVEFKTDNRGLFDFSVEELELSKIWKMTACTYDLHNDDTMNAGNIMTEYEEKFSSMNNPICKLVAMRKTFKENL